MTTPAPPPPPAPPPAAAGNDKTTLWGVLGIVLGLLCCWPLGVVFGFLSLQEAKKVNKPPTLAYLAFGAAAINFILGIIYVTTMRS